MDHSYVLLERLQSSILNPKGNRVFFCARPTSRQHVRCNRRVFGSDVRLLQPLTGVNIEEENNLWSICMMTYDIVQSEEQGGLKEVVR